MTKGTGSTQKQATSEDVADDRDHRTNILSENTKAIFMTESEYQASLSLEGRTEEKRHKPEQSRPEPGKIPEKSIEIEETEETRIWDTPYYATLLWVADNRLPPEVNEINETIWRSKYRYHDPQNIETDKY